MKDNKHHVTVLHSTGKGKSKQVIVDLSSAVKRRGAIVVSLVDNKSNQKINVSNLGLTREQNKIVMNVIKKSKSLNTITKKENPVTRKMPLQFQLS